MEELPQRLTIMDEVRRQHELFDESNRRWLGAYRDRGGRIFCAEGCRNCCNLAVHTTFPEALLVAEHLTADHAAALDSHLFRLQEHLSKIADLKSYLKLHRRVIGSCPFLEESGACGVYAARPLACRSLLSTRPGDWCGVGPATLDPWDRKLFLDSLDSAVVAYPTHYAPSPQERGREFEERLAEQMREAFGYSLSGNLTILVHLERNLGLSAALAQGYEATAARLSQFSLARPPFLMLDSPTS